MSKLVAIRIPDDLAERLDNRCSIRKQGKTEVLLEAIERGWHDERFMSRTFHQDEIPPIEPKLCSRADVPSMAALRSICAGNIPQVEIEQEPVEDATPECCECGKQMAGKLIKGRGVVYACATPGCPMWGKEQRAS
jgi:hypothetical protein